MRAATRDRDLLLVSTADGGVTWLSLDGTAIDFVQASSCSVIGVQSLDGALATLDARKTLTVLARGASFSAHVAPTQRAPKRALWVQRPAYAGCWSADGKTIGVRGDSFTVLDAHDGRELASWTGEYPMQLWNAHGLWIVYFRSHIDLYESATRELRGSDKVPSENLRVVAMMPNGVLLQSAECLVVIDADAKVQVIDTGMELKNGLKHHSVSTVRVSSNGQRAIVSRVNSKTLLIALPDGAWIREIDSQSSAWGFSQDDEMFVDRQSGLFYRSKDGSRAAEETATLFANKIELAVRRQILSPTRTFTRRGANGAETYTLVDSISGATVAELSPAMDGAMHPACPLVFGDNILLATYHQDPWLYSLANGQLASRLPLGKSAELRTAAVSCDGELLTLNEDGLIQIW